MICPNCGTSNDSEYIFCVNCGTSISASAPETLQLPVNNAPQTGKLNNESDAQSVVTVFPGKDPYYEPPKRPKKWLYVLLGLVVLTALGIGAVLLVLNGRNFQADQPLITNILPAHLGLFAIAADKASLAEISKLDVKNLNELAGGPNIKLRILSGNPEFILYADPNDIKVNDLKLLNLNSISDKGVVGEISYQVSLVDGKPEMKRFHIQSGLPNGKYAFTLIDGSFNEGKHRIWLFEIGESQVESSKLVTTDLTIALKDGNNSNSNVANSNSSLPVPSKPAPTPEVPVGSRVAFINASSVIVRDKAGLTAKKINQLKKNQRVFVISYSDNYDNWNGIQANWAYIQTENGKRGWVFTPFISY